MSKLTEEEILALENAKTDTEWNSTCDEQEGPPRELPI